VLYAFALGSTISARSCLSRHRRVWFLVVPVIGPRSTGWLLTFVLMNLLALGGRPPVAQGDLKRATSGALPRRPDRGTVVAGVTRRPPWAASTMLRSRRTDRDRSVTWPAGQSGGAPHGVLVA
jgi:hypothetical protein